MISINRAISVSGVLFLTAIVTSLLGGGMIESKPGQPLLIIAVFLEVANALSVFGIGILLFPILKQVWKNATHVYLGLRMLEALACLSAALIPLFTFYENSGLRAFHTGTLIPLFFCCGALIFYTILFKYRLLPRFITVWGWFGVMLIIYLNVNQPQGESAMLFAIPIILNEIFLGIWLMAKGFNPINP